MLEQHRPAQPISPRRSARPTRSFTGRPFVTGHWRETSTGQRGLLPAVDQDSLLPSARRFIGSMDAPRPAARSLLAFQQRVMRSHDASLPGCGLLGVIDPADKLVSTERRQRFPQGQYARVRSNGGLKVVLSLVHGAMEKSISQKTSTPVCRD
jgi:hypothetical protein